MLNTRSKIGFAMLWAIFMMAAPGHAEDFSWIGTLGDTNSGGNWSAAANWNVGAGFPDDTNDTADLRAPLTSERHITNDVATTVDTVFMEDHTRHHLWLDANLTADTFGNQHDIFNSHVHISGQTLMVGRSISANNYMPRLRGDGLFIKYTTGTCTLQGTDTFTGSMIVSNGTLNFRASTYDETVLMTVLDAATAAHISGGADFPTNVLMNGHGFGDNGAVKFSVTKSTATDFIVNTDSKMKTSATATLTGDILGTGCLTLEGSTWILAGTGVSYTNTLKITNGTVQVTGDFSDLKNVVVDGGGVLEALQSQFPSASIVTQNGGIWNTPTSATWTGGGDGSNWTDTANWAPPVVPTEQADLRDALVADRYIVIDSNTTIDTIVMEDSAFHHLVLSANLTVDTIDGAHDKYFSHIHMNGHTLTVSRAIGPGSYMPRLDGPGLFLKVSSGTATLQGAPDNFSGEFVVSNGTLNFRASQYTNTLLLTVLDGATAKLLEPGPSFPPNIVINGTGFSNQGALSFTSTSDDCDSDITTASDSKIVREGTQTTTLTGDITGPGDLTLDLSGGATFDLDGVYNFAISGTNGNSIVAGAGTLDISGATLSVSGEEGINPFIKEFIIIDYSGGATVSGRFAATNDLKVNWGIDYDGTEDNPDAVVLVQLPTSGSVLVFE